MVQHGFISVILSACLVLPCRRVFLVAAQSPIDSTAPSYTSPTSSDYPLCRGDVTTIEDALCNVENNNAACGYDGGDCCECTCIDGPTYTCGEGGIGFFCIDPAADCVYATVAPTPSPFSYLDCLGSVYDLHDGYCDTINNNADCGWDGGDCCECTCTPSYFSCGQDDDTASFHCLDPDAECFGEDTPSATPTASPVALAPCAGLISELGDGKCDAHNNNALCGYDLGDCCECTCTPGKYYSCESGGGDDADDYYSYFEFDCVDPVASCPGTTPSPVIGMYPNCTAGYPASIGDGRCDASNNNEECGYDGGDCCECTCVSSSISDCAESYYTSYMGYYYNDDSYFSPCIDPEAECRPTPSPTNAGLVDCDGLAAHIGDGFCDSANNNKDCGYDGGDCCECTCVPGDRYSCNQGDDDFVVFDCRDPDADCPEDTSGPTGSPGVANVGDSSSLSVGSAIGFVSMGGVGLCCVGGVVASLFYACRGQKKRGKSTIANAPPDPASSSPMPGASNADQPPAVGTVEDARTDGEVKVPSA